MKNLFLSILFFSTLLYGEKPDWIFGKSSDEVYIYGVGSAEKMPNFSLQRTIAEASARSNLSENIRVEIKSIFERSSGTNIETKSSYKFIQTSGNSLNFSFVKEKWIDEKGTLHILMAMEKTNIKN
jgi:hypothetical protein